MSSDAGLRRIPNDIPDCNGYISPVLRILTSLRLSTWIAIVVCLIMAFILRDAGIDDVGISYRYARHLGDGQGLTWNVGEEPVEGYSNLLWVLVLALCHAVGLDIELSARALSLILGLLALVVMARLIEKITEPEVPNRFNAAPIMVALAPAWIMWMMSGLEIALYGLLLVTAIFALTMQGRRRQIVMSAALAALTMTRPEGMVLAGVYVLSGFLLLRRNAPGIWREFLLPAASVAVTVIGVTIFRLLYYGYLFPNTVYAKFSTVFPSAAAVGVWVLYALPFLVLWAVTARWWWPTRARVTMAVAISLIVVQTLQILPVDPVMHFLHRYTIAFLPLLFLPVPFLLARISSQAIGIATASALALWLASDWPGVWRYYQANAYMLERQKCVVAQLEKLGKIRIAMFDSGRIPYWTDLPAIDIAGLCDRYIAHEGFAPTRVLEHPNGVPDVIIAATIPTETGPDYPFGSDRWTLVQPRFDDRYDLWTVCAGERPESADKTSRYRFYDYAIFLRVQ